MTGPRIEVSRRVMAAPKAVFDAWIDPARAGRWLFATQDGEMEQVEIDGQVGGHFRIVERRDGKPVRHEGQFLELDRPHRLSFAFAAMDGPKTIVEVRIEPDGTGARISLVHQIDPAWEPFAQRTREGWEKILEGLAATLAKP